MSAIVPGCVGRVIVFEQGCFCRERQYVPGRHPELSRSGQQAKIINGGQGVETELTIETITPNGMVEVVRDAET